MKSETLSGKRHTLVGKLGDHAESCPCQVETQKHIRFAITSLQLKFANPWLIQGDQLVKDPRINTNEVNYNKLQQFQTNFTINAKNLYLTMNGHMN